MFHLWLAGSILRPHCTIDECSLAILRLPRHEARPEKTSSSPVFPVRTPAGKNASSIPRYRPDAPPKKERGSHIRASENKGLREIDARSRLPANPNWLPR